MPNVTLTDPSGLAIPLVIGPAGSALPVSPIPTVVFADNFDGTVIDVANRWSAPVLAGSGTLTQAGGNLIATLGTTASNGAALTSQESFSPSIGNVTIASLLISEAVPSINTNRHIGFRTLPGSWTAATPVQDGYVWELDIAGTFGISIYNTGARIYRVTTNPLTQAPFVLAPYTPVGVSYQGLNAYFFYGGNFNVPVLTVPIVSPSLLNLPIGFGAINHTAGPALAPTWSSYGLAAVDQAGVIPTIFNGQALSRQRSPGKFINVNAASIAAEATIWTPAAGRRFRLMGYVLESGTIGGNVILKDNIAGTTILIVPFGAANGVIVSPPMGNGILSAAAGNVLTATGTATQTLSGYIFGAEE
jgi:hypothetical protein